VRAVDCFAGWGGFTTGAFDAGVEVVWAADHWPVAVEVHQLNHPGVVHVCEDLRATDWAALPDFDLLLASPACQGHSTASQPRRRSYHDTMRATAWSVVDCAEITTPKAIIVENVPAFTRWKMFPQWAGALEALGYTLDVRQLTASRFGVPQRRRRLVVIATRGVRVRQLPGTPTEPAFAPCLEPDDTHRWLAVADAPAGVQARIARSTARHGPRFLTQHTTDHTGTPLHEPIRTITTAPSHWNLVDGDRYRPLSPRELARGMGFPDSYTWPALPTATITKGLGNAIPPPLAATVIAAVADAVTP